MQTVVILLVVGTYFVLTVAQTTEGGSPKKYQVVYSWTALDYDWANDSMKEEYEQDERFLVQNNVPSGIRVFKDEVYVTVPRYIKGVPATLNKLLTPTSGKSPVLQPFPSWDAHTIGDCNSFQFIQAIEIDPNTGIMWIVDTGRTGIFSPPDTKNSCPAKIVTYDIDNGREVGRYTFPEDVVNQTANYLNDIVLDYVGKEVAYAYITDSGKPGIVVYDVKRKSSYRFEDAATMSSETGKPIVIQSETGQPIPFDPQVPINGIAMSSDFQYVYFSPVSGTSLYQVPTSALRDPATDISTVIRKVGDKPSQGDGMVYTKNNLYFGGLNDSSLYRWEVSKDTKSVASEGDVTLTTVRAILSNVPELTWLDTFAIDEKGYLWFSSSSIAHLFTGNVDFTSSDPNFWILKTRIDEMSYLSLDSTENKRPGVHGNRKHWWQNRRQSWLQNKRQSWLQNLRQWWLQNLRQSWLQNRRQWWWQSRRQRWGQKRHIGLHRW